MYYFFDLMHISNIFLDFLNISFLIQIRIFYPTHQWNGFHWFSQAYTWREYMSSTQSCSRVFYYKAIFTSMQMWANVRQIWANVRQFELKISFSICMSNKTFTWHKTVYFSLKLSMVLCISNSLYNFSWTLKLFCTNQVP